MIFQKELITQLIKGGSKIAIENEGVSTSYSDLLQTSDKITDFLLRKKIPPQTFIGVMLNDRQSIIHTMLGVMNARCVFVPIDSTQPKHRLNSIKEQLNLEYIITAKGVFDNNLEVQNQYFLEDVLAYKDPSKVNYPEYKSDDSIYVYFTSGSTGVPKGIIGKNASLKQFIDWEVRNFKLDDSCRVSQFISPYFDAFLRDVFVPIFANGTLCLTPKQEDFFTAENMIEWIDSSKISLIHSVPSLLRVFHNHNDLTSDKFNELKYILLSGEKIRPAELENWYSIFDDRITLVNLYGTTETTMIRSFYEIKPGDVNKNRMPIGNPIDDTELLILNKDGKICNVLITGDLYIVSDYMSKGYLNNPELNKEKFIEIRNAKGEKKTGFRTGDRARMLPSNGIELLGREDRQIKLRGMRVELDELENILMTSDIVDQAVVIHHTKEVVNNGSPFKHKDDVQLQESLIAFVVPNENLYRNFITALEVHIGIYLPKYMAPSNIIELKEFPLLANGKIDFKALSKKAESILSNTVVEPINEIEEKLVAIWHEIIGDIPISTEESFQKLGGNSISIMRLIARIYNEFEVRIPLSQIFKNLTIKSQANFIKEAIKDSTFEIPLAKTKSEYDLSAAQERIFYTYHINATNTSYNIPMLWNIKGNLSKERVDNILKQLIARHESLRTSFIIKGEGVFQKINENIDFQVEEITDTTKNTMDVVYDFIKPFNLGELPLIRCGLLSGKDNKKVLLVDIHHIICDGVSQMNLFSEFTKLYKEETLEPLKVQYKDYAEWETNYRTTDEYRALGDFWFDTFEGELPKLKIPNLDTNDNVAAPQSNNVFFNIDVATYAPIEESLKNQNITLFSGFFTAYLIFLAKLTKQDDLIVGINTSGRVQKEVEGIVGMFVKTLPIRQRINYNLSFKDFTKDVHDYLIKAQSNQLYDLADLMGELSKKTGNTIEDLFSAMFVFQNYQDKTEKLQDLELSYLEIENTVSKYPITLFAVKSESKIDFRLEYSQKYFTKQNAEELAGQFKRLITEVAGNINGKIIDYIDPNEDNLISVEDNIDFNF